MGTTENIVYPNHHHFEALAPPMPIPHFIDPNGSPGSPDKLQLAAPQKAPVEARQFAVESNPSGRVGRVATAAGSLAGRASTRFGKLARDLSDSGLLAEAMSFVNNCLTDAPGAVARTVFIATHLVAQYETARQAGWPHLPTLPKRRPLDS